MLLLRSAFTALLLTLAAAAQSPRYDSYGGWTELKGKPTGFFHIERIQGRSWLITPDGNAFFSKGVCHISCERENKSAPPEPQDKSSWAKSVATQLRQWNFNTVGAWSDPEMFAAGMPYTVILDLAAASAPDLWLNGGVTDVFSKEFRDGVSRQAKTLCQRHAKDPMLVGYFTDNEMRWGADWRSKDSVLETFASMPPGSAGQRKAAEFLRGRAAASISEHDKDEFTQLVAAEYARVSAEAIRRYDKHHLILGCRFAGYASEAVLKGVGPHFDVISYNTYNHQAPLDKIREITTITGKPTMITEFSFKAMDSGLPNARGGGKPVATQQDRATMFDAFVRGLASLPDCLGFHWFQYRDQPMEGRTLDGENCNYGVVKLDGSPWPLLTSTMTKTNAELEPVAAKLTPR